MNKIISELSDDDLCSIAKDMNAITLGIADNAVIRVVAAKINNCDINNTTLFQMIGLAPAIALELSNRLKECNEILSDYAERRI